MNTLPVLALSADGTPVPDETFTVTVLLEGECSWCGDRAEYKIASDLDGWIDWACQFHRERYWSHGVSLVKA